MNESEALAFLRTVQPLPDDELLTEELIGQYDDVREYFVQNPCEDAVPLFLNSFGNGDGLGVYQLVEDAIVNVNAEKVVPYLLDALTSPISSVRYWTTQISANFDDDRLVDSLLKLLGDESTDIRLAALVSLEKYVDESFVAELVQLRDSESEPAVRDAFNEILAASR